MSKKIMGSDHATCMALIRRYRGAIEKALMRLGSPTMSYWLEIEKRELWDSNIEAAKVLEKALFGRKGS